MFRLPHTVIGQPVMGYLGCQPGFPESRQQSSNATNGDFSALRLSMLIRVSLDEMNQRRDSSRPISTGEGHPEGLGAWGGGGVQPGGFLCGHGRPTRRREGVLPARV